MLFGGTKPGKEDPSYHEGKAEGLGECQAPQSSMPHHIAGMAGGFPNSKQCREQPSSAFLAWALDHHHDAHMSAIGILIAVMQIPMFEPPKVKMASTVVPEFRKQDTRTNTNIYRQIGGRFNSERDIYLWTDGIIGTYLKR